MDPNFQKCTFLAFLSIELCACSLIFVAFLIAPQRMLLRLPPRKESLGRCYGLVRFRHRTVRDGHWYIVLF